MHNLRLDRTGAVPVQHDGATSSTMDFSPMQIPPALPETDLPTTVGPSTFLRNLIHSPKARLFVMERPRLSFFDFPPEVRELIYRELLVADALSVQSDPDRWDLNMNIHWPCRQMKAEGKEVFLRRNCFIKVVVGGTERLRFPIRDLGTKSHQEEPLSAALLIILGDLEEHPPLEVLISSAHLLKFVNTIVTCKASTGIFIAMQVIFVFGLALSHRFHERIMRSLCEVCGLDRLNFTQMTPGRPNIEQPLPRDLDWFGTLMKSPLDYSSLVNTRFLEDPTLTVDTMFEAYKLYWPNTYDTRTEVRAERLLHMMRVFDVLDGAASSMLYYMPYYAQYRNPNEAEWVDYQGWKMVCVCLIAIGCNQRHDYKTTIRYILKFKKPGGIFFDSFGRVVNPLTKDKAFCLYEQLGIAYFSLRKYEYALHAWFEAWMLDPKAADLGKRLESLIQLVDKEINRFPPLPWDHPTARCRRMLKPLRLIMNSSGYAADRRSWEDENAMRLLLRKSLGDIYKWQNMQMVAQASYYTVLTPPPFGPADPVCTYFDNHCRGKKSLMRV